MTIDDDLLSWFKPEESLHEVKSKLRSRRNSKVNFTQGKVIPSNVGGSETGNIAEKAGNFARKMSFRGRKSTASTERETSMSSAGSKPSGADTNKDDKTNKDVFPPRSPSPIRKGIPLRTAVRTISAKDYPNSHLKFEGASSGFDSDIPDLPQFDFGSAERGTSGLTCASFESDEMVSDDFGTDIMTRRYSNQLMDVATKRKLSSNAFRALKDFCAHLKFLKKDCLDEEAFDGLLDDMDYRRDRTGLFRELQEDVAFAKGLSMDNISDDMSITVDDMGALYSSLPYQLLDGGEDSGDALMTFMDELFDETDEKRSGKIARGDLVRLTSSLLDGNFSDDELNQLFEAYDVNNEGGINRKTFKGGILAKSFGSNQNHQPQKVSDDVGLPKNFNYNLMHPAQTTADEFVAQLESFARKHSASNHHLLHNLSCAAFGWDNSADLILRYLTAYSVFSDDLSLTNNVENLVEVLDNEKKINAVEGMLKSMGSYDEETLAEFKEKYDIDREAIEYVGRDELFTRLIAFLEEKLDRSYKTGISDEKKKKLTDKVVEAARESSKELDKGPEGLLSALYFGGEVIAPQICKYLLLGLKQCCNISNANAAFLILQIDEEKNDLAKVLRQVAVENSKSRRNREKLVKNTELVLASRVKWYNELIKLSQFEEQSVDDVKLIGNQFNEESTKSYQRLFDHKHLLDLMIIFDMCENHVKGATVLNVGCGEGFAARRLKVMGAEKIIGIDDNKEMIDRANERKGTGEFYIKGDASSLTQCLKKNWVETNMMLGAQFCEGGFDLCVTALLFNVMPISMMNDTMEHIYLLLRPGGYFIFSVPHPFMLASNKEEIFGLRDNGSGKYFSLRDKVFDGMASDGNEVYARMHFKTLEDYVNALQVHGFDIVDLKEARVTPEFLRSKDKCLESVIDIPFHLIFKVRKPRTISSSTVVGRSSALDALPKKLIWSKTLRRNFTNSIAVTLPKLANEEVLKATLRCYRKGIKVDQIVMGKDVAAEEFKSLKSFCRLIRKKLLHDIGVVLVKGLDMTRLGSDNDINKLTACSKIAYFLICEHVGPVDATARGRLFDVKNSGSSTKTDNVLFSVSDTEAGWHTDGCSKDICYDVVSLLCITPAVKGGKFKISNSANVYDHLNNTLPKFMMYELTRPVPRDVLENGNGEGTVGLDDSIRRSGRILSHRVRYNSYPIYVVEADQMRFRYMRYWIETGHKKTSWKVPTLLRIAMDILDDELDKVCCFHDKLVRGDIVFTNNAIIAHARDSFENDPYAPPRHKVRAWLQAQKADMLNGPTETDAFDPPKRRRRRRESVLAFNNLQQR